ncbi:MAG: MFS transporter [Planctomycetes bacterium]|nr:MFS transporter [Planctomycetota bacterium]
MPTENRKSKGENTPPPLYRNLSFTLMWTSTAASGFGDRMIMLAAWALLGGMAAGADSTGIQASTQFFFFGPYILISIPGGWLADRLPRKWLLLSCDEARGLLLLGSFFLLGWVVRQHPPDPETGAAIARDAPRWVWAALAAVGAFAAIFNPTRNAIIPQIIPRPSLPAGNAVILVIAVVASMIGMLVGGKIIKAEAADSVSTGLLVGALLYLISGLFFAFLKPIAPAARPGVPRQRRSHLEAAAYCVRHRRVLALIGLGCLVWSAAAAVSSGIPGLAKWHYGLTGNELTTAFTTLSATMGAGMLAGAGLVIAMGTRRESSIILNLALAGVGASILVFVLTPWMPVTYAAAFVIGVFGNIVIINVLTLLQSISPNYIRGRIMGFNSMVNTIFSVFTYFAIWRLPHADRNIIFVMYGLGPLLAVVGLLGLIQYMARGPLRRRDANAFWHLNRLFCFVFHRVRFIGKHRVPHEGAVVLASNHTSALDPFALQAGLSRKVRWLMLTPYLLWPARPLWRAIEPIALDRDSSDSVKLRAVAQELRRGEVVGIFPEGGLQRSVRQLQPFQPGAAVMARLGKAVIVPAWVEGTPVAESMLRHMFQPSHTVVVFGEPWTPDTDAEPEAVMAELRQRMLALRDELPEE